MPTTSFIVIETPCGRATPTSAWIAASEQDYMARVQASNPRSGDEFADFEETRRGDESRHAMRVEIMYRADFESYADPAADLSDEVLDRAEQLGWYAPTEATL